MPWNAADINADLGDVETAAAQFEESLTLFVEFGDRWFGGIVLESAAFLAAATGDAARSVRLLAAADAIRTALEVPLWVGFRERHDRVLAETRNALGEAASRRRGRRVRGLPLVPPWNSWPRRARMPAPMPPRA
jgi:hypothetical protein